MSQEIEYIISNRPSKFLGYHQKNGGRGEVKVFLPNIWQYASEKYETFVDAISYVFLLERICLERGFQRIRLQNRCGMRPYCKMETIAQRMFFSL